MNGNFNLNYDNDNDILKRSMGPSLYTFETPQENSNPVYAISPTLRIQKKGISIIQGMPLIDIESDLNGSFIINSNNPQNKYNPKNKKSYDYIHLKDGLFEKEDTNLNQTMAELKMKDLTKNRWENLFFDPQKNSIEPFKRLGDDTYLQLDNYENCPVNLN
tara:strand:- start:537 stop:1019 length:483 start_codon:yes stop_codon:yes gene_type:complete